MITINEPSKVATAQKEIIAPHGVNFVINGNAYCVRECEWGGIEIQKSARDGNDLISIEHDMSNVIYIK